jgi:hypothetical protein
LRRPIETTPFIRTLPLCSMRYSANRPLSENPVTSRQASSNTNGWIVAALELFANRWYMLEIAYTPRFVARKNTLKERAPWAPWTRVASTSAVAEGPIMKHP